MLLTALVAVLGAVCVASPAAASVTRGQAAAKAIAALGVKKGSAPVIVFRGSAPVAPGARIAEAGLSSANAASLRQSPAVRKMRLRNAGVRTAKAPTVARVGRNGAWFFYADKAPFKAYQHPGQVVLVDAETGKVTKTRTLMWPPLINGRLPAFMRSAAAYRSKTNYAFYRPYSAAASSFANAFAAAAPSLERSAATQQAADTLAAQHACAVRISDTLGDFYDFGNIDSTRAQLGLLFEGLEALNPGFISERYSTYSNRTPTGFIQHLVDTKGCKQILVYVAGGGIKGAHSTAVIGQSPHAGGTLDAQYLTSSAVARLIGANRGVEFDVLVDAPYSDGFATALAHQPNVALVLTPSGGAGPSFTFLPEIKTAKGLQQNTGNPAGLLEFTNRLLVGAGRFLSDPAEVQTAAAQTAAGFQAWMFGRAFQNSADVDFPAQLPPSDVAPPAQIETPSGVTPTPPPPTPPGPTTPVNTPPVATGQAVTTAEDTAKAVTLAGIDADSDPLTFAIATQPAHGALTGTGPNLTYTPEANYNGPDSFTFTTSDGHASSAPATVAITVTPVNDAPSAVGTDNSPLGYIDGAPAVAVWPTIALSDIDNADLAGATVAISSGRDPADQLQFTNQSGITGAFSAATGILTLTGSATKANYETALRSVAFASSGAATGQRSVTFVVSDGPATSAPIARTVFVDDAPTDIALTNTSVDENQPSGTTVGTLSSIDPDAGDSHTYSLVAGTGSADNGSFQINGTSLESNASFNYEAKSSYSIRVRSDDGHGGTFEKQFTISVADLNDAPTADAKTITGVTEDVAKAITLSGDDEDGNALTFSIVSGPAHGGLGAIAAPSCAGAPSHCSADVTYTPDPDYNGADSFTYKANDGTADSATKTVAITVDAVNDAPVASDGSASLNEDATKSVDLSALVTDVDNSVASLTYTIVSPPAHGGLTGSGVSRTYTPDADYNGPDSFTYKAGDGTDDSATKTVSITVDPVNDVPQASDTSVSLSEDGNKAIDLSALVSDLETSNANLTYTVV
ncbi:MAG: hypothetical protein QOF69_2740, partial [Solirubrobacteraceae bacterium]|nr:hypothetical protein [Solirubrobacteraceae bacterium]